MSTSESNKVTNYFRSAVAAQSSPLLDFSKDKFWTINQEKLNSGELGTQIYDELRALEKKKQSRAEGKEIKREPIPIIICAKTIKTVYQDGIRSDNELAELTGIYYIPALLDSAGKLNFDGANKKIPWFPRKYLQPLAEPSLSLGEMSSVDNFISSNLQKIIQIEDWQAYRDFFRGFFEGVTKAEFTADKLRNCSEKEDFFALEDNIYLFKDETINATFHILNLYNDLLTDESKKKLYENFISLKPAKLKPLSENTLDSMKLHYGQMGGAYPLSPSQREAVNHFNNLKNGDILAVNGPPGTGKTTLLQSIVADLYVKKALNKEKAPVIVASSTNNQAVTNIIASFGSIDKKGLANLEERWVKGVNSFATYFPSQGKVADAKAKGYHYTDQQGNYFVSDIDNKENIEASKVYFLSECSKYFGGSFTSLDDCQQKLYNELIFINDKQKELLKLVEKVQLVLPVESEVSEYISAKEAKIKECEEEGASCEKRKSEWDRYYSSWPFLYRFFLTKGFLKDKVRRKILSFLDAKSEESALLEQADSFEIIENFYENKLLTTKTEIRTLTQQIDEIKKLLANYQQIQNDLKLHGVEFADEECRYISNVDSFNEQLDTHLRYLQFWYAVHYYECRWLKEEEKLTEKQVGKTFANVLEKFYHRLSMLTPCFVMTFFVLPGKMKTYEGSYLYNFIDLLIVDEAGQVSPEVAACSFALAKKALVVGDIYQIEPVWSIDKPLDRALAQAAGLIGQAKEEFEDLLELGLNTSDSSVMKVAAKSCEFEKFGDRGLFLSEHRRCYDEIIEYCNQLVYKGNLKPMRGSCVVDKKRAIKAWPALGCKQIESESSERVGTSRVNKKEAQAIAQWLKDNISYLEECYQSSKDNSLIGIITPFKGQSDCIKKYIKQILPEYQTIIDVGTVHTFQGAERKVIIFSTVYGSSDGCFFIDASKSLMNVAVSRAKDHFFVFGDLNCLKTDNSSASGLMRKFVQDRFI